MSGEFALVRMAFLSVFFSAFSAALGATQIAVSGPAGKALEGAAVWAEPAEGFNPKRPPSTDIELGQRNKAFERKVSIVEAGRFLSLPNHDVVRHHVYSFSKAKTFDVKLYANGETPAPVELSVPGLVVLGCNIHDSMLAYVWVVPTPWHAISGSAGTVDLDLPQGRWIIKAWHPSMGERSAPREIASLGGSEKIVVSLDVAKK